MEELYRWADRYSTLEDNIRAATQIVMTTSKSAKSNKPVGKKPSESKEGQSGNRKQSHDQLDKIREPPPPPPPPPPVYPLEHLIREATSPHSQLARFQVPYTDPDRSLLKKPIHVVRLSQRSWARDQQVPKPKGHGEKTGQSRAPQKVCQRS